MRMKQGVGRLVRYAAVLAGCLSVAASPMTAADSGGSLTITFSQVINNPCTGAVENGNATVTAVVVAGANGGALVSAYYAPAVFSDINGNSYQETGAALGAFTTQTSAGHTYTFPLVLKFKGQNGAQSFSILIDEIVTVNQSQAPTSLSSPGVSGKCGL
jgi:hypothetical protein